MKNKFFLWQNGHLSIRPVITNIIQLHKKTANKQERSSDVVEVNKVRNTNNHSYIIQLWKNTATKQKQEKPNDIAEAK